ncbi:ATP-grasp fold amidoligase family protein [Wenyingzhuangia sp. IMCC45533]
MKFRRFWVTIVKKCKFLHQKTYVRYYHEYYSGKQLDYDDLKDFNEKIQWYKVFYHLEILTLLVDKYSVKDYVREKVGEHILNETIKVYEKSSLVDFKELPNQFVIKGVHGCGFNLIVSDKSKLNKLRARFLLKKWMMKNQYYRGGLEWAYKNVKPRLMAEPFLSENGKSPTDYKFYCFNGVPTYVRIDSYSESTKTRCFYDMNWIKQEFTKGASPLTTYEIEKPINFNEMIEIAAKLSEGFPFVRVDLYAIEGKTIFGEMTFYPRDGRSWFYPYKYNKIIGDLLVIPKKV